MQNPRSYREVFQWITVVYGLGWGLLCLAIDEATGADVGGLGWIVGGLLFFGPVMALFVAPKWEGRTARLRLTETRGKFTERLNLACTHVGYEVEARFDDYLRYKPGQQSTFSFGPLQVAPGSILNLTAQLSEGQATLVGPRAVIETLVARMGGDWVLE